MGERFSRKFSMSVKFSAWEDSGIIMAEAEVLEQLIQLKLENPNTTRESALKWALEMREIYQPKK